ncbi:MAG TPA: DUF4350 domain-containing protein [Nocardioides sp.]|uniref:DUF4350 domain-containing protein n=1 Tax=Nocardioides sp. TaxID=35761 RepID=UPI002F42D266
MRWLGRHRVALLVVLAAVVAVAGAAWAGRGNQTYAGALDPRNPDGDGAQALARVLDQQGVEVDIVRSADAFDRATVDGSTTVVVTSTGRLGRSTTDRLLRHRGAADLVIVEPGPQLVRELGVGALPATTTPTGPVAAGCPAYDGLSVRVSRAQAYRTHGCFRGKDGVILARPRSGLTLLGASAVLTNDQIIEGDNAAVALRLLGARQRLVWYIPSLADLAGADSVSVRSLLPDWLVPALWLLLLTGIALIAWRARRLGPLASEPLPVSVKAVETTRNLGRLYRRAGDRGHAAGALRSAARARLAERLRLPRRVHPGRLVEDVAAHTGRPAPEVDALIGPTSHPPRDDRELVSLASRLTELDREVSQR